VRKTLSKQLSLVPHSINHPRSRELARISALLDMLPETASWVAKDLGKGTQGSKAGRIGMSGEQVLRAALLKQMHRWSYDDLAFHLEDSPTFRTFCRIGLMDRAPKRAALAENIKRMRPETLEQVNRAIVKKAQVGGIENGQQVRIDSTVVDSNIHHPLDSSLLYDVVRVLTRLLRRGAEYSRNVRFSNHNRRAKRRMLDIHRARNMSQRQPLYRELVQIAQWTMQYASQAISVLQDVVDKGAWAIADQLNHYLTLANKVVDQTERRVLRQEAVPPMEKIVSIFEPHTDIIVKDRRETLYGHKIFLNVGKSGMIVDMLLERGNPADAARATTMLERHRELMGKVPEKVAFDAGFSSAANVQIASELGIKGASFAQKGVIDVFKFIGSPQKHKKLQRFRAGVEGIISFAKRCFGLGRCLWHGYRSFRAYTWMSVLGANLLLIARA
jgi:IS5 family transposase